jgi:rhodanese-related sulfurtransferase
MKNVLFAVLLLTSLSCHSQNNTANTLDPNEFEKGISNTDIQILDVRTAAEFNGGHIKNALLADWNNNSQFLERVQYVDKQKPVYIYCLAGGRSAAAAAWMRSNGYSKVIELIGGMNAWKKAGKPVEGLSNEPQLTIDQYYALIPKDKTVLVDFGASWCPPCIKMNPALDSLQQDKDLHFSLVKIDAGLHTDIMKTLDLPPIPVFIIYKNGKEKKRLSGYITQKELRKELK